MSKRKAEIVAADSAAPVAAADNTAPSPVAGDDDIFNPENLKLPQDFAQTGVKKLTTVIPVRKPNKSEWFRTHPDPAYHLMTAVLEVKSERGGEFYLVTPTMARELAGETVAVILQTTISRQGVLTLWPIRVPDPERPSTWHTSALDAAERARHHWIRMVSDMALSAYRPFQAAGDLPPPVWPAELTFQEIITIAFRDRMITSLDHPVVRQLRGLA
jgi:hypothetical protein